MASDGIDFYKDLFIGTRDMTEAELCWRWMFLTEGYLTDDPHARYMTGNESLQEIATALKGRPGASIASLKREAARAEWSGGRAQWREHVAGFASGRLVLDPATSFPTVGPACPPSERDAVRALWALVANPIAPARVRDPDDPKMKALLALDARPDLLVARQRFHQLAAEQALAQSSTKASR